MQNPYLIQHQTYLDDIEKLATGAHSRPVRVPEPVTGRAWIGATVALAFAATLVVGMPLFG